MKRQAIITAFLFLLTAFAQLQFSGEPLVVPGSQLGWEEDELRLILQVKKATDLKLQLYSPGFDPTDYRSPNELGDERYDGGQGPLYAYFRLSTENGSPLVEKTYGIEPHRWDTLYAGHLQPGNYQIYARFSGNGKNAVAFRLDTEPGVASIVLQPDSMQTYNVHGHDWQDPFTVNVPDYGAPLEVGIYDGDGPEELQVRHTFPNGVIESIPTPGNREWVYVTLKEVGEHKFGFRRPKSAYQLTNTVGIKVFYGPIKISIVDTNGQPVPGAGYTMEGIYDRTVCLQVPPKWQHVDTKFKYGKQTSSECVQFGVGGGEVTFVLKPQPAVLELSSRVEICGIPTGQTLPLQVLIGDQRVVVDGEQQLSLPPGNYPVTVEPIPGAKIHGPSGLILQPGQVAKAQFLVEPQFELELSLAPDTLLAGERASLNIHLKSSFPVELIEDQLQFEILWPEGFATMETGPEQQNESAAGPHVTPGETKAFIPPRPGHYRVLVRTLPCGPSKAIEFDVVQPKTARPAPVLERELDKHVVVPGEKVEVALIVRNKGDANLTYDLRDNLPTCLRAQAAPEFTGVLAPGESRTHRYPAQALFDREQRGELRADLSSNGGDLTATDHIDCVLVPLQKSASQEELRLGEQTTFVLRVQNPTDHRLTIQVKDVPASGLGLSESERSFDLAPGEWGEWRMDAAPDKTGKFVNKATPYVNGVPAGPGDFAEVAVRENAPLAEKRRSQIFLPFQLDGVASDCEGLLIAHRPPEGSSYVPGSSRLNGEPLADPRVAADGRLIWSVPPQKEGVISYWVAHQGPLPQLAPPALTAYSATSERPIVGSLSLSDYESAQPLTAGEKRLILEPEAGGGMGMRDRITVKVRSLDGKAPILEVNGEALPQRNLGEYIENKQTKERIYVFHDVPLKPGKNTLRAFSGGDSDEINVFVAGKPVHIVAKAVRAIADGRTPVEVEIRVEDENGLPLHRGAVAVQSSIEPLGADGSPELSGYRVVIENGRGILRLKPTSTPQSLKLKMGYGELVEEAELRVAPSDEVLWLAHGSITARYDLAGHFELGGRARGYVETPLMGGHFQGALDVAATMPVFDTSAVNYADGLDETEEPNRRFPLTGSGREAELPLVSDDGVAFHYDHGKFSAGYQRLQPVLPGVEGLPQMTALHLESTGSLELRGFAALIARTTVEETIIPDGTRVYWLSRPVRPGSERLVLRVGATAQELVRLRDYVIDYPSGVIFLSRPLWNETDELLPVRLHVTYAPQAAPRDQLAAGAGLSWRFGSFTLGVGAATLDRGANWRFGAELAYRTPGLEAALSYGRQGGADRFGLSAAGRSGFLETRANLNLAAGVLTGKVRLTGRLSVQDRVVLEHRARATENRSELTYERSLTPTFSLGAGLGYVWESAAPELLGRARYAGSGLSAELTHAQPFGLSRPETRLLASYAFDDNLQARADLDYTWGERLGGSLGLEQKVGFANLAVSYVLPGASGEGNRARFGIRAPLPLARRWSLDLSAGYDHHLATGAGDFAAGVGVRYASDRFTATLGLEGAKGPNGGKLTLRSGASGQLSPEHSLGFDANYRIFPDARGRFSLAYAFRGRNLSLLTYHRLSNLTDAVFEGELAPTWHPSASFQLRPSFAYRLKLDDPAGNTFQAGLAGNAYLTRRFGLGAGVYYQWQPAASADHLAFSVEASLRAVDAVWLNLGYTFGGFSSLMPEARPGIYIRIDLIGGAQ